MCECRCCSDCERWDQCACGCGCCGNVESAHRAPTTGRPCRCSASLRTPGALAGAGQAPAGDHFLGTRCQRHETPPLEREAHGSLGF
jgi:hypothetical protein